MKIGILGTSNIAFRRFLPALKKSPDFTYAGVASRTPEKGAQFVAQYGGEIYPTYDSILEDDSITAVYVPLPPALHYEWGRRVLEAGKMLLMEKPFTTCLRDTEELLALAEGKRLAVHENYMFAYHSQLSRIRELMADGTLGELRLLRASFGFPKRSESDFRYNRDLGGGALLDCGGYPLRLATELLGPDIEVVQASLTQPDSYDVDLFGNTVVRSGAGIFGQISFGMDNAYQCQLELWGSNSTIIASRIFTAGAGVCPELIIRTSTDQRTETLPEDDQFLHSIERFAASCRDVGREDMYRIIRRQAVLVEDVRRLGS